MGGEERVFADRGRLAREAAAKGGVAFASLVYAKGMTRFAATLFPVQGASAARRNDSDGGALGTDETNSNLARCSLALGLLLF